MWLVMDLGLQIMIQDSVSVSPVARTVCFLVGGGGPGGVPWEYVTCPAFCQTLRSRWRQFSGPVLILWSSRSGCWASRCSWIHLGSEAAVERLVGPSGLLKLQAGDQQKQTERTAGEGGGLHEGRCHWDLSSWMWTWG